MKKSLLILGASVALVGCNSSSYEMADLTTTSVYEVINPEPKAAIKMYSVYPELSSLLRWENSTVILDDQQIHEFQDTSDASAFEFQFCTITDGDTIRYHVSANRQGEVTDRNAFEGELQLTSSDTVETLDIEVRKVMKFREP